MNKYTVVLTRPSGDSLADGVYVGLVEAPTPTSAAETAAKEAQVADRKDGTRLSLEEYDTLVVFAGHHNPVLFGWNI